MPEASRQSAPGAPQPGVPGTPQPGAPETTPRSVPASTPRRSGAVLATTLVALFLVPFTLTGASVALSDIARQLDVGLSDTQWVVNAYSATFAAFMLVTGSWADRFGARRVFAAGVALFAACGLLAATAGNIWLLDAARLLAGIGAAATTTGASAVLAGAFTGRSRARVFGLFGTTIGVGLAFGPTVASQLVDGFGWRAAFALPGLVGAVCLLGVPLLPRPPRRGPRPGRATRPARSASPWGCWRWSSRSWRARCSAGRPRWCGRPRRSPSRRSRSSYGASGRPRVLCWTCGTWAPAGSRRCAWRWPRWSGSSPRCSPTCRPTSHALWA
ncbi:MFS transporter [Streptomyces sp. NBC_00499]|uniref:MFS transporter n=1 Tax=Streptomyces sp. NBC_00499 TaxID=2975761 RepID=UPI003867EC76